MSGLLKKDLALIIRNKRTFVIMILIALLLLLTGGTEMISFAMAYLVIICGMMTLTTISYDEFDHGMSFLLTLPVTRKSYVLEKYVLMVISMLIGFVTVVLIGTGASAIHGETMDLEEMLIGGFAVLLVLFIMMLVMLPLTLKFGSEKSRMVLMSVIVVCVIAGFAVSKGIEISGNNIDSVINGFFSRMQGINGSFLVIAAICALAVTAVISVSASLAIVQKKEY